MALNSITHQASLSDGGEGRVVFPSHLVAGKPPHWQFRLQRCFYLVGSRHGLLNFPGGHPGMLCWEKTFPITRDLIQVNISKQRILKKKKKYEWLKNLFWKCSKVLAIGIMKMKNSLRFYLTQIRGAKINNNNNNKKRKTKGNTYLLLGGVRIGTITVEIIMEVPRKTRNRPTTWFSHTTVGHMPTVSPSYYRDTGHPYPLLPCSQLSRNGNCLFTNWWVDNEKCGIFTWWTSIHMLKCNYRMHRQMDSVKTNHSK